MLNNLIFQLFKFSNSSAAYNPLNSDSSRNENMVVAPNSFYATRLYPLLSAFTTNVSVMCGQSISISLKKNLDEFVDRKMCPKLDSHYFSKVTEVLQDHNAFQIIERIHTSYTRDEISRPLLMSTIKVYDFVKELLDILKVLTQHANSFNSILSMLLQQFYDASLKEYNSILQGTETYSRFKSTNLQSHLSLEQLWVNVQMCKTELGQTWKPVNSEEKKERRAMKESFSEEAANEASKLFALKEEDPYQVEKQKKYYNKEAEVYETKYTKEALPKSRIITDHSKLIILATLCDSLEWISAKFFKIVKSKNSGKKIENYETVLDTLRTFGMRFEELSENSLMALRVEMRHHCFSYLSPIQNVTKPPLFKTV